MFSNIFVYLILWGKTTGHPCTNICIQNKYLPLRMRPKITNSTVTNSNVLQFSLRTNKSYNIVYFSNLKVVCGYILKLCMALRYNY